MKGNLDYLKQWYLNRYIRRVLFIFALCLFTLVLSFFIFLFSKNFSKRIDTISYIYKNWQTHSYENVYKGSDAILQRSFLNNVALCYKGYSAFYLAVATQDTQKAQDYLDAAIISLRLARLKAKKKVLPQIDYMLGKSYFYKNTLGAYHYYADLALKYLQEAKQKGYYAKDVPECLGLSFAALGATQNSIAAFTEALLIRESDTLLLAIAEQYYKNHQYPAAKQYLSRVEATSNNDNIKIKADILLGCVALEEEDYKTAKQKFQNVLEKDENNADAYYGQGVVQEKEGDLVKARASWRTALRLQAGHPAAAAKIAQYR